jgi:hypothetical protein
MPADTIPQSIIESAWNEVANMEEAEGQKEITRISKQQPALLAFVMADSEDLSEDAQQLGLFIFVIVLRMFEKQFGEKLKSVELENVQRLRDQTEEALAALQDADEKAREDAISAQASNQPFVMKYIAEAIFDPDPEDGIRLTEDEIGALIVTLKTVVDALEEAAA